MRLPERDEHPTGRDADKATGDHVAHEMVIGADESDGDGEHRQRVKPSPRRIIDPQDRDHRAGDGGVARRERCIAVAAVKEVKTIDAVAQEGRIVVSESVGPGAAERQLQLDLGQFGDNQAKAAEQGAILEARQRAPRQIDEPEDDKYDHRKWDHRVWRISEPGKCLGSRDRLMKEEGNWSVEPFVGEDSSGRSCRQGQNPFAQTTHRLIHVYFRQSYHN